MTSLLERLRTDAASLGVPLDEIMLGRFERYAAVLLDWNARMNLTAIREPEAIAVRHFADSLTLLAAAPLPPGASVIDVGTGAGFPGVALKIARPDLRLTLVDSLGKRVRFLEALLDALGLEAACLHARAEEAGRDPALRDRFDLAAARAVAPLRVLSEWCLPFVRPGGCFAAMKGPDPEEEAREAENAVRLLGAEPAGRHEPTLSDGSRRTILLFRKTGPTPPNYPRPMAQIAKKPL